MNCSRLIFRGWRPIIGVASLNRGLTRVSVEDGVKHIIMNSPKTRNALSLEMLQRLNEDLKIENEKKIRCIVIRGVGPAFSGGHNLKEMTTEDGRCHHERIFESCERLMHEILECPVPVIAAIDGTAAAAGCQLVAMTDIAVATKKSTFSTPGSSVGIFCSTPGVPLARNVPRKISAYMLYTGKAISGEEALRAGLISRLVEDEIELEKEISDICEAIRNKPRAVITLGKRFFVRQIEMGFREALGEGGKVMVDNLRMVDAQEGISAFKEKRSPKWTHTDSTTV